jgi:hypothetical protein
MPRTTEVEDDHRKEETMERKAKKNELPLLTLGEDELSLVAGGCGGHHRHHHHHHHHHREPGGEGGGALAEPTSGEAPALQGAPGSIDITIFQVVAGNTAPVTLLNLLGL